MARVEARLMSEQLKRNEVTNAEYYRIPNYERKKHFTRLFYTIKYQSAAKERKRLAISNTDLKINFNPNFSFELKDFNPGCSKSSKNFMTLWNNTFLKK